MAKIKIVHLLHSIGGVDVYLRLVLQNLSTDLFENIVVHGKKDTLIPFVDKNGNKVHEYKVSIFRDIEIFNDIKSIVETYKIIRKERPNLIHAHSAKGGIVGRIVGRVLGIKVLYTPHAFSYLSTENKFKRNLFLSIEKWLANGNSTLLATSQSEKDRALDEVGYQIEKTLVFNNCIEPIDEVMPLTITKTWPDTYICTVGRPSYQKNIEQMIRVMHEVNKEFKIHLVVMGVGPVSGQLDAVKQLIRDLKMENQVTLLNWTARSDVFNIISNSKFYLSTSRYEGMPYSIIESLALAKACIVSNCDGNKDLISDNFNGFVINSNDNISYNKRIVKLLTDQVLLEKLSKNAFLSYAEKYNIKNTINELEAIYTR